MKFSDSHNDLFTYPDCEKFLTKYRTDYSGHLINFAVWGTRLSEDEIICRLKLIKQNNFTVTSIEDISNIKTPELILEYKPYICSLGWNYDNRLIGGALGNNSGLTKEGEKIIQFLNISNIIIDTAHSGERGFYNLIDKSDKIINTHTAISGINKHPRNLNDGQIKLIIEKEGYIGITFVSEFLTDKNFTTSDDAVRHIDYFVQKFGDAHIGIGSDFFGTESLPLDINSYEDWEIMAEKLNRMGYSSHSVNNIMYNNFYRLIFSDKTREDS